MNMIRAVRRRFTVGRLSTARDPATLRQAAAELLATAIFVFAAEGATLSLAVGGGQLVAVALAHALALAAAVSCAGNVSGAGHVNPAVTFGALLAGRICLVRSLLYCAAQLLGSVAAAVLLRLAAGGTGQLAVAGGVMSGWQAAVLEAAMAFGLTHAYFATVMDHPRRPPLAGPVAVGMLAGANVLACGALEGAVMNPARAFGPALVGSRGRWGGGNHWWVYWAGPMVGAGLYGVVYEHLLVARGGGGGHEEKETHQRPAHGRRA